MEISGKNFELEFFFGVVWFVGVGVEFRKRRRFLIECGFCFFFEDKVWVIVRNVV